MVASTSGVGKLFMIKGRVGLQQACHGLGVKLGVGVTHLPLGAVSWVMPLLVRRLLAAYRRSRRSVSNFSALLTESRSLIACV